MAASNDLPKTHDIEMDHYDTSADRLAITTGT
jgi:hypothetical protein